MLEVRDLQAGYGSLRVLHGLSLTVPTGKVVALLGGNGAGKTTTMLTIAGLLPASAGTVSFEGQRLHGLPAHRIFARGVALVAQGRRLFPEMTVRENLEMGALAATTRNQVGPMIDEMFAYFPRLAERAEQRAASLSGGEQQMLATGRALMSQPRLLLLDEPTTGLAPIIVAELVRLIRTLNARGLTILLVEQNVHMALQVAEDVYVMRNGSIVMQSKAAELQDDSVLFSSYLG
jgi:branched-chain amino acid transport system ATP-binding protein